jgi:hypothetical protein
VVQWGFPLSAFYEQAILESFDRFKDLLVCIFPEPAKQFGKKLYHGAACQNRHILTILQQLKKPLLFSTGVSVVTSQNFTVFAYHSVQLKGV